MADASNMKADEAARLGAALERIALAAATAASPATLAVEAMPGPANGVEIARRLDVLIADLRAVLGRDSSD